MPLIKSPSKKAFKKNVEAEMKSGKPQKQSLAIAYSIQRRNKSKKMANGGMVEDNSKKTIGDIIGYPGSKSPQKKAMGGMIEDESSPESIAEAIRRKRRQERIEENSEDTADEPSLPIYDDLNEMAGEEDDEYPQEENSSEELSRLNRIAAIRRRKR